MKKKQEKKTKQKQTKNVLIDGPPLTKLSGSAHEKLGFTGFR